jgi:hypothetical protein
MKTIKNVSLSLVVLFISVSLASCKKPVAKVPSPLPPVTNTSKDSKVTSPTTPPPDATTTDLIPKYEILKKTQDRSDNGLTFYIIIRPINLSTDAFVGQIKNLVKQMVKDDIKNEKITIEVFDSMNALDMYVKDKNSKAPLLQTHHIARYVGDSEGEIYKNTLYIFPNSTKDDKSEAGKYFDIIDFDPSNW